MSVREYVGARYVPIVVGEWDSSKTYEPLMVVTHEGSSYTSRQYVPAGIDIANESYWILSANYNAQVDAYRKEVQAFDGRITANAQAVDAEKTRAKNAEQINATAIDAVKTDIGLVMPFDTTPTIDSVKGVTSGGIYNAIQTAAPYKGKNVVSIGDSVMYGSLADTNYMTILCDTLQMNLTNLARPGYGLLTTDGNYYNEINDYLKNHDESVRATIDYVFIAMTINDGNVLGRDYNTYDGIQTHYVLEMRKFYDLIQGYFPNAYVTLISPIYPMNTWLCSSDLDAESMGYNFYWTLEYANQRFSQALIPVMNLEYIWPALDSSQKEYYYGSNNTHPNGTGQRQVGKAVLNAFLGRTSAALPHITTFTTKTELPFPPFTFYEEGNSSNRVTVPGSGYVIRGRDANNMEYRKIVAQCVIPDEVKTNKGIGTIALSHTALGGPLAYAPYSGLLPYFGSYILRNSSFGISQYNKTAQLFIRSIKMQKNMSNIKASIEAPVSVVVESDHAAIANASTVIIEFEY